MFQKDEQVFWMKKAIELAKNHRANKGDISEQDIPVAAIILDENKNIISTGVNNIIETSNPLQHAEIVAINDAYKKTKDLRKATMIVTLEPCVMCAGAIAHANISRVIFGAYNEQAGGVSSKYDILRGENGDLALNSPNIEVCGGVLEQENKQLLDDFFAKLRESKN